MMTKIIRKIVVPTDLSNLSTAAIDYVMSNDIFSQATVYVLHTVEITPLMTFPPIDFTTEEVAKDVERDAEHEFAEYFHAAVPAGLNAVAVLRRGEPYKEITQFASENDADLIVIATHGRTGLSHALLGSVAEKVVRHSTVPVLTIKPTEARSRELQQVEETPHSH